jgi:CheY-like chemotaxis protein
MSETSFSLKDKGLVFLKRLYNKVKHDTEMAVSVFELGEDEFTKDEALQARQYLIEKGLAAEGRIATGSPDIRITIRGINKIEDSLSKGARPFVDVHNPETTRPLRVFLCHSSSDKPAVRNLYHQLNSADVDPWLDEEKLLPGQDWDFEIKKAIRESDVVIVCLSRSSVNKEGYVQKEVVRALDIADEKPEGTIFIIPLKLEECEIPQRLNRWHCVNFFDDRDYEKLKRALDTRASELGLTSKRRSAQTYASSKGEDVTVIKNLYPLSFSDLVAALKNRYPDFRVNKRFFEIKKELEKSEKYCKVHYLNASFSKWGINKKFYSNEILEEFDKYHREMEGSAQITVTEQRVTEDQILIIEDDELMRELLTLYLSREFSALSLVEASDATEAIEQLSLQKPCIVILDSFLAEPESCDVLEVLNYQDEGILIIFLTASEVSISDIISNFENIHSGQIEILQKPFDVKDLGIMIHHLLSPDKSEND